MFNTIHTDPSHLFHSNLLLQFVIQYIINHEAVLPLLPCFMVPIIRSVCPTLLQLSRLTVMVVPVKWSSARTRYTFNKPHRIYRSPTNTFAVFSTPTSLRLKVSVINPSLIPSSTHTRLTYFSISISPIAPSICNFFRPFLLSISLPYLGYETISPFSTQRRRLPCTPLTTVTKKLNRRLNEVYSVQQRFPAI